MDILNKRITIIKRIMYVDTMLLGANNDVLSSQSWRRLSSETIVSLVFSLYTGRKESHCSAKSVMAFS